MVLACRGDAGVTGEGLSMSHFMGTEVTKLLPRAPLCKINRAQSFMSILHQPPSIAPSPCLENSGVRVGPTCMLLPCKPCKPCTSCHVRLCEYWLMCSKSTFCFLELSPSIFHPWLSASELAGVCRCEACRYGELTVCLHPSVLFPGATGGHYLDSVFSVLKLHDVKLVFLHRM